MPAVPRRPLTAVAAAVLLAAALTALAAPRARAATPDPSCANRVLVLSAMPLELNPLYRAATITSSKRVDDRSFYVGTLAGANVVLAMTGIGPQNAFETTTAAFDDSGCTFRAVVFSGVAGSKENIGDVTIPQQWTSDGGASFTTVNSGMFGTAQGLAGTSAVPGLSQDVPVGDAACLCPGVDAATPVHMPQPPKVVIGGAGETSDPFGGHAVPCVPGGGDVAGCEPCITVNGIAQNAPTFASKTPSLVTDPSFWEALFGTQTATTGSYEAQDEETAIVSQVATAHSTPFLGVRAVSDGQNDPLHLPGFPAQFFVYRQLSGNNAAATTIAFLERWVAAGYPTGRHPGRSHHG